MLKEIKVPLFAGILILSLAWVGAHKDNPIAWYIFLALAAALSALLLGLMFVQWSNSAGDYFDDMMNVGDVVNARRSRGAIIGYKWLRVEFRPDNTFVFHSGGGCEWKNWTLEADQIPTPENTNGIYACFSPDDQALAKHETQDGVLVEVELRGQKVIHERGARGQIGSIRNIIKAGENVTLYDSDGNIVSVNDILRNSRR